MNLYNYYNKPNELYKHQHAHDNIPTVFFEQLIQEDSYGRHHVVGHPTKNQLKTIAKSAKHSFEYATALGERFPQGEKAILTDPELTYGYTMNVINVGRPPKNYIRWPEGEKTILKDPETAFFYAADIIRDRWPEAEKVILDSKHGDLIFDYITRVINKHKSRKDEQTRWLEAEKFIANSELAYEYAMSVIKDKWPEGEEAIAKDGYDKRQYNKMLIKKGYSKSELI